MSLLYLVSPDLQFHLSVTTYIEKTLGDSPILISKFDSSAETHIL